MNKIKQALVLIVAVLALTGCGSIKNIPYFKNAETADLTNSAQLYDARIMPKDMLTIYVHTTNPEISRPFNLTANNGSGGGGANGGTLPYLVDNEGYINFPVLGKMKVMGLTKNELQDMICAKLKNYLAETETPIVTVRMSNFHITVIGEVGGGGVISIPNEGANVIEALAMAGDLTIYGRRDNIMLIRADETGHRTIHRLNINETEIFNSPYFYVQQNDIIYVESYKMKERNQMVNTNLSMWYTALGFFSSISTVAALILSITKK